MVWNNNFVKLIWQNSKLQIISQNYVVWNEGRIIAQRFYPELQIISQNYVVWNQGEREFSRFGVCVANYITKLRGLKHLERYEVSSDKGKVANYITKLRGLKLKFAHTHRLVKLRLQIISQNYVVWNRKIWLSPRKKFLGCKLYHKTTWFETQNHHCLSLSHQRLQIISQNYVVWNSTTNLSRSMILLRLQIISQNYVVWNIRQLSFSRN